MREIKRKWILANVVNEALKAVVVLAGLFILGLASGIAEGTVQVLISVMAIIGLCYICRDCMDAVVELEDIIRDQERSMRRKRRKAAELSRRIEEISTNSIDVEVLKRPKQRQIQS